MKDFVNLPEISYKLKTGLLKFTLKQAGSGNPVKLPDITFRSLFNYINGSEYKADGKKTGYNSGEICTESHSTCPL